MYCSTGVSAVRKRESPGEMIGRGASSSACTWLGETSAGMPNTGPTVIGGIRTLVASACSDGRFGERRRPTVPAGRSTRRKAAELNEPGTPLAASEPVIVSGDVRVRDCAGPRNCRR